MQGYGRRLVRGRFVILGGIVTCEIIFPAVLTLCVRRQNKIDGSFYECIPSLPQIFHCVVAEQFRLHSHSLDGLHQCIYAYGGELQQDFARQVLSTGLLSPP